MILAIFADFSVSHFDDKTMLTEHLKETCPESWPMSVLVDQNNGTWVEFDFSMGNDLTVSF